MLEFIYAVLIILCFLSIISAICFGWIGFIESFDNETRKNGKKRFLIFLVLIFIFAYLIWYSGLKLNIKKYESIITTFEEYANSSYSADYIIEPPTVSEYVEAKGKLNYYKSIGMYKFKEEK